MGPRRLIQANSSLRFSLLESPAQCILYGGRQERNAEAKTPRLNEYA
jgi:hypothetical protein